jgi:aminomethyltransferase
VSEEKGIGMGYVDVAFKEPGTAVQIAIRGKVVPATVVKPPFISR